MNKCTLLLLRCTLTTVVWHWLIEHRWYFTILLHATKLLNGYKIGFCIYAHKVKDAFTIFIILFTKSSVTCYHELG